MERKYQQWPTAQLEDQCKLWYGVMRRRHEAGVDAKFEKAVIEEIEAELNHRAKKSES